MHPKCQQFIMCSGDKQLFSLLINLDNIFLGNHLEVVFVFQKSKFMPPIVLFCQTYSVYNCRRLKKPAKHSQFDELESDDF